MTTRGPLICCPHMKKMKWILISVAGILALGGGGGWLALRSWVEKHATPEAIVRQVEAEWNCRADVAGVDVSLFSNPARIVMRGFSISPRDGEVGKPLAQRAPAPPGPGLLMVHSAILELDTNALAGGRLHVKKLGLSEVWLREEITPEGLSVMQETFRKPKPEVKVAAPVTPPAITANDQPVAVPATPESKPAEKAQAKPANGSAGQAPAAVAAEVPEAGSGLPFGIVVDEAVLEKATFRIRNRQARTTSNINDLYVRISEVDVDSGNLAEHNQCKVEIRGRIDSSGRAKVGDETKDIKFADFSLNAHGLIKPLDDTSKAFAPHGQVTLELEKGGVFGGTQTIGQAAGKDKSFAKMKDNFGIDVSDLVIGGVLQETVSAEVSYERGRVLFPKDVRFAFPEYAVTLRQQTWINAAADDHDMHLQLLPSDPLAKSITDGVTSKMGDGMVKLALSIFNDGHGKLAFEVSSSGRLSKPNFRLDGKAGAIEQLIRGLIK